MVFLVADVAAESQGLTRRVPHPFPAMNPEGEPSVHEEGSPWLPGACLVEGQRSLPAAIAWHEGEPVIP